ncbi:MAG TPA: universal stress protein, partial [Aggregatilineales bacterium]|nr:universal stress protein [Aggregatilineales bacterium]
MLKHILVPLDQSELSETAIEYARNILSPDIDSKITFLYVVDIPATSYTVTPEAYAMSIDSGIEEYENLKASMRESAAAYLNRVAGYSRKDQEHT